MCWRCLPQLYLSHNNSDFWFFLTARNIDNKWKWWKIAAKMSHKSPKSFPIAPFTKRERSDTVESGRQFYLLETVKLVYIFNDDDYFYSE